jgi:hypothetical protein
MTIPDGTLALTIDDVAPAGAGFPDGWRISWSLTNLGAEPLEVLESWLPHDQFRASRGSFEPPLVLPSGGSSVILSTVQSPRTSETIENAFLILRTRSNGQDRRLFARLRIEHEGNGRIRPVLESLTTTPVGFVPGRDLTIGP